MIGGKITSLAGLRKAIEELRYHADSDRNFSAILKLISEFEAGVREANLTEEEMILLEGAVVGVLYASDISNDDYTKLVSIIEKIKKLRKILGEGERR